MRPSKQNLPGSSSSRGQSLSRLKNRPRNRPAARPTPPRMPRPHERPMTGREAPLHGITARLTTNVWGLSSSELGHPRTARAVESFLLMNSVLGRPRNGRRSSYRTEFSSDHTDLFISNASSALRTAWEGSMELLSRRNSSKGSDCMAAKGNIPGGQHLS